MHQGLCPLYSDSVHHQQAIDSQGLLQTAYCTLKGHWLERAGFVVDTPIKVRVMERCLVLTA
ncbi:SymE family type I addiction module toxin, partial [Microbulbifer sp. 2205BS26-8]|uniref:SymE family type I addiction module toxin n=1 Tax=Microbulbifer sp. 2205BS26-8 TaxID=3064386 RepID=UPI0035306ED4